MNGQYHHSSDFWGRRMEPWQYDRMKRDFRKFLRVMSVLGVMALIVWLLCGCKLWNRAVAENKDSSDSVRIEYRERIVKVPVTVYVEVPVEQKEKVTRDSTSHLETSFAVSDAAMIWIDGVPFLRHTLANIPQKIEKEDTIPVTEKEKIVWKTRRVTYTKTEIRERQLVWWQKGLMWAGAILSSALPVGLAIGVYIHRLRQKRRFV